MCKKMILCFCLFSCFSFLSWGEDVQPPQKLILETSSSLVSQAANLKAQWAEMERTLEGYKKDLTTSQEEQQRLETVSKGLSLQVQNWIASSENFSRQAEKWEAKFRLAMNILIPLAALVILDFIGRIICTVLRVKGVKIPHVVDVIL